MAATEGINSIRERDIASLNIFPNMLEQHPGAPANRDRRHNNVLVRVTHSSGMLEGNT
jgi:hypothetical protein